MHVRTVVALALACLFAVPGASAGWIQVPPTRPCPALPDGYVCSTTTQIRFGYPATWGALTSSDGGLIVRSLRAARAWQRLLLSLRMSARARSRNVADRGRECPRFRSISIPLSRAPSRRDVSLVRTSRCRTPCRARHQRVSPATESLCGDPCGVVTSRHGLVSDMVTEV